MQRILGPGDEFAPAIFGVLPQDFDHIEFRAVRRQEAKHGVELCHPAQRGGRLHGVADSGVIKNDKSRRGLGYSRKKIAHECGEGFTTQRAPYQGVKKLLIGKIEGQYLIE